MEDGFEREMMTGAIFVALSAAYDTINYQKLLHKLLEITKDSPLTKFTQIMLSNRRFFVILNDKRSKWRNQKMAYHRVVFWPHYSLTSTQMTSLYQEIHKDFSMQMNFASPTRTNFLKWLNSTFERHYQSYSYTNKTID